jgi:hypothetical protein
MSDDTAAPDKGTVDLSDLHEVDSFRVMRKWIMVGEDDEAIRLDQMCLYFEIDGKKYGITFKSRMMADQFIFLLIQGRDNVWPGAVGIRGKCMEA